MGSVIRGNDPRKKAAKEQFLRRLFTDKDDPFADGIDGDFYIEPKPKEPMKNQYDFDAAIAIGFLRQYGLDKNFKMHIEANHAPLEELAAYAETMGAPALPGSGSQ